MESQARNESLQVSKEELDQNMNSTVSVVNECKSGQYVGDTLTIHEEILDEVKTDNTQFDTEQTEVATKPGSPTNMQSEDIAKSEDNFTSSEFEQSYSTVEDVTLNDIDVDKAEDETNSYTEGKSIDKPIDSLSKPSSILAAELMSDSSHLASNIACNRSATASPQSSTGSVIASPEVVTTNKSSSSKSKLKQRRRGSAWTDDETDFLMEVWAQQSELMKLKGGDESVTCAPVYRLISRAMGELGFDKSWEQCKTRIHTLKRAYKITKDEIDNGAQTITYCRHFDKLEIISGDNAQITPGMLASGLEQQRKQRDVRGSGKKLPVKRKLTVGENPNLVKRNSNGIPVIPTSGIIPQLLAQAPTPLSGTQNSSCSNMTWYPPQPAQQQQLQQQPQPQPQQSFLSPTSSTVQQSPQNSNQAFPTPLPQASPAYSCQQQTARVVTPPPPYSCSSIVNGQNGVSIKPERTNNIVLDKYPLVSSSTNWHTTPTSTLQSGIVPTIPSAGNDIERMRLDLEMRKLEVERNKIEMEERQRREDRDHQYRMMQLLMFGLGQQNSSQMLSGQGTDVTQTHSSTDLLRALENGLVPGWSQKVNEKGLSFSEL